MSGKYSGSCLCGAVRFEVSGEVQGFFLCHCSRCRKGTGSAHASNIFCKADEIVWLSGEAMVRTYSVEGTRHQRSFCEACGSAAPRLHPFGGVVLPAGSLDTPLDVKPTAHICCADRADWDDRLEEAQKFDGLPWS